MADYKSAYTGAQIDAAIAAINNVSTTIANALKTDGVELQTPHALKINTTGTGGRIWLNKSKGPYDGFIDVIDDGTTSYLRACRSGYDALLINLGNGQITSHAQSSISWWGTREADFYGNQISNGGGAHGHFAFKTRNGAWAICDHAGASDSNAQDAFAFCYAPDTSYTNQTNNNCKAIYIYKTGQFVGGTYNDYAETRKIDTKLEPGTAVYELGNGTMSKTTERLMRGCHIISDTFGFSIGPRDDDYQQIAVSGRVLAHLYEDRDFAREHIGWPVCSGPNGTVSIMTEEEEQKYPSRIIGIISEIPDYDTWSDEKIPVNGRIWIYVK